MKIKKQLTKGNKMKNNGGFTLIDMLVTVCIIGILASIGIPKLIGSIRSKMTNLQSVDRAFQIGQHHYDIGNDLFSVMLDKTMMYTCGYWTKGVTNLEESQIAKLNLVAKKLDLQPGMKVLDIGCGWGGAAKHFSENYGVSVVGITVSKEQ